MTTKELIYKLDHNQEILEIASSLSYAKFDDLKDCNTAKKIWDRLKTIHGGDDNVLRPKEEICLRGNFDDMKMMGGENIVQYCTRLKEVVNAIWGSNGTIEDEIVISKVFRTLLHIYAIRVSTIQQLRCTLGKNLTLEGVVGRHFAFEMSSFDN